MDKQESQSFGRCIWQARRKKGLSQRELAAKVGVDSTYLSKLENDHVEPSEKVIRSLAEHLSLNALELIYLAGRMTQHDSEALEELVKANYKEMPALFRRVRENPGIDSLVKARDERIARLQKENAELKAKVSSLEKELQIYKFYSKEEIERVANNTLKLMHKNNFPPRWPMDASRVADSLDIAISFAKIVPDEQGPIVAKILPMEREIILNQDIQELQGKLHESTIAHEIGHWLMHVTQYEAENLRKEINNNLEVEETQNIFFCRSIIEQLDTYKVNIKHDHIEWQAEYFASCLLMPTFKLEEVRRGRDLTNWRHLYAMQDDLGVTISNLINRLQDLGWIYIPEGSKQIYPRKIESVEF
ncbi:helix-turn-helix domain-containing protein [Nostoc sp. DedQUE07]|uniref:helix-turn-helix domain-containing protein n=1 Tax=Nostoc sp. DedQUE07 TaxID=3075392 RepID=UPI002AD257CD|nr:helix-turn-helix domain-containing protein [Nostoc sp. DedQUE07]MDZ8127324.1 helix-turn-helix domain-containing protein [Nostoc sp. DedQUE07]